MLDDGTRFLAPFDPANCERTMSGFVQKEGNFASFKKLPIQCFYGVLNEDESHPAEEVKHEDKSHERNVNNMNWGSNAAGDNYVQKKSIKQQASKGLEEATDVFGNSDDQVYLQLGEQPSM